MLPDSVSECPHCGSNDGYYYKEYLKFDQYRGFGNLEEDNYAGDFEGHGKQGACRCQSCDKIIKRD